MAAYLRPTIALEIDVSRTSTDIPGGTSGTWDGDFMIHTSDTSPFPFYHGNWGIQVGASVRLNRGTTP